MTARAQTASARSRRSIPYVGAFTAHSEIESACKTISERLAAPFAAITYSPYYVVQSLSFVFDALGTPRPDIRDLLRKESLKGRLKEAESTELAVLEAISQAYEQAAFTDHTTFARARLRPGEFSLTFVWTRGARTRSPSPRDLQAIAQSIFNSRSAAFHRDLGINGSIERQMRRVSETFEFDAAEGAEAEELENIAEQIHTERIAGLISHCLRSVEAESVSVFYPSGPILECSRAVWQRQAGDSADPLDDGDDALEGPTYLPDDISLMIDWDVPVPPELGGSRFADATPLLGAASRNNRSLVGVVDGHWALTVPFGDSEVSAYGCPVLCITWPNESESSIGAYEIAFTKLVANRLAEVLAAERTIEVVRAVASQLGEVTKNDPAPGNRLIGLASDLADRQDLDLASETFINTARHLVALTKSVSVTCRLITGGGDPTFARNLARVHCEGEDCALASPNSIDIEDWPTSVNAWVARFGRAVYLSNISDQRPVTVDECRDLARYPGLNAISLYRDGIRSELCVPVFAENRLVGTINLESRDPRGYDLWADVVSEFSQVVGVALLESRRKIGVKMMVEAGGFLDRRHDLAGKVRDLQNQAQAALKVPNAGVMSAGTVSDALSGIEKLINAAPQSDRKSRWSESTTTTITMVIKRAMKSSNWLYGQASPRDFVLVNKSASRQALAARVGPSASYALQFALDQAFRNLRTYDKSEWRRLHWPSPVELRMEIKLLGGVENLYLAVRSACPSVTQRGVNPHQVFREPIERAGRRVALGAYLAGEMLRRVGGAAVFKVEPATRSCCIVTCEFSVPLLHVS